MSTRAQIRFATREAGQSFNKHPDAIHAQFYKHSDGYPEGLGLDIADSIMNNVGLSGIEIEPLTHKHGDLDFIYYIWQAPGKETFISIFETNQMGYCETCGQDVLTKDQCIFVGLPTELINKYSQTKNE
tara:strand:+ start:205 stop:591 length:387 start_codon:yes stop_codon:yes gene_type:complete